MAYSLSARFSPTPKYYPLCDPGTYQFEKGKLGQNRVPFLSNVPRKTDEGSLLWTQATYDAAIPHKIPNITSLKSKQKRFPYQLFIEEDNKDILCKCGIDSSCVCPKKNEQVEEVICHGKARRYLYKGPVPRSILGEEGLSVPSKNHHGFTLNSSGPQMRLREAKSESPPFYDTRINEFTTLFKGCKWSQRTSKKDNKSPEQRPGPADYYFERKPTEHEICIKKLQEYKRKTSKQPRFIEIVQQQNIREGRPGPASYNPMLSKGTNLKFIGPKANRFFSLKDVKCPGPTEYQLHRTFDLAKPPQIPCQASIPKPASFGVRSQRFRAQREVGPSPATYNVNLKTYRFVHFNRVPFGTSAQRFQPDVINDNNDEEEQIDKKEQNGSFSSKPMWIFKSKTIRMKFLSKKIEEPSPADILPRENKCGRSSRLQYTAPFYSSNGRFQPWYNWIPIHGKFRTPTPCDYNTARPMCFSTLNHGPIFRSKRFPSNAFKTPAPNTYNISDGIETILKTHNIRLIDNLENQHKFIWNPPSQKKILSYGEREQFLIQKCINLLEPAEIFEKENIDTYNTSAFLTSNEEALLTANQLVGGVPVSLEEPKVVNKPAIKKNKSKLLRTFLYVHQLPRYF